MSHRFFLSLLILSVSVGVGRASVAPEPSARFLSALPQAEASRVLSHPHLLAESELYLGTCRFQKTKDHVRSCRSNQANFVVDYVDAFYNHISAQENLAFLFSGAQGDPTDLIGLQSNKLRGCAWALATLNSSGPLVGPVDGLDAKTDCRRLSPSILAAAKARASLLIAQIHEHVLSGTHGVTMLDKFR